MDDPCSDSDEELGLLRKALDVELPGDFDPNKIPQNGTIEILTSNSDVNNPDITPQLVLALLNPSSF